MLFSLSLLGLTVALFAGVGFGYLCRRKRHVDLNKVSSGIIVLLIFSLGFSMGSNNELLASMPVIGFKALVMVFFAVLFSVLFMKVIKNVAKIK